MADKIEVISPSGKTLEVFEKAFNVYYSRHGYKRADEVEEVDLAEKSVSQLKRVSNDDLRAYLDEHEIEYDEDANKDELIALIKGE